MNRSDATTHSAFTSGAGKNICYQVIAVFTAIIVVCWAGDTNAADKSPDTDTHANKEGIKMDEPMKTGMMKQGMMQGDVKSAAEKKAREMLPMMEQEEKSMPQDKTRQ